MPDVPKPALEMIYDRGVLDRLPPPWFVPVEAPACGVILNVPAEWTTDGIARRFVCDRVAGHVEKHRQVTDINEGRVQEWKQEGDDA